MGEKSVGLETFGNFHPDKIKIVCILAIGRSSSIFFQGLFGNHPEVITLPAFFYPKGINLKNDPFQIASEYYSSLVESLKSNAPFDEKRYSFEKFKKPFLDYISSFGLSRKNLFIASHYAFSILLKKNNNRVRYILYHPHSTRWFIDCFKDFPNIKLFVTVRDPRANFASEKLRGYVLYSLMGDGETFFLYNRLINKIGRQNIQVIKHELLHTEYQKILNQVCSFLSVKKTSSMLYSSFFGIPNDGSYKTAKKYMSTTGITSSKPDSRYVNQNWITQLSAFEINFVQGYQSRIMKEFDYKFYNPFEEPNFRFIGTVFRPLTKDAIEKSNKLKRLILRIIVSLARAPILGYVMMFLIQAGYYTLKYCKHFINLIYLGREFNKATRIT